jgi:MFS family permease
MNPNVASRGWQFRLGISALFCGHAGLALVYDALPPILVPLAKHYGGGERGLVIAQLASSLPYFGIMVAGLLTFYPVRRWGFRNVLLFSLLLFGLSGSAGAVVDSAALLLATRFALGLATGTMITCSVSYIAVNFDEVFRARMTGWLLACGSICAFAFILVAGYVASIFNWRTPFLLHAVISIVFLIPVLCMSKTAMGAMQNGSWADLPRLKRAVPAFAAAVGLQVVVGTFVVQLAFLVGSMPFGTPSAIANVFALLACASTASSLAFGKWFATAPPTKVLRFALVPLAGGMILAAYASSPSLFAIAAVIFASGSAACQLSILTWAMQTTPPDLAARSMGLVYTCIYFGTAAGPALAAPLLILVSIPVLCLGLAALVMVGLVAGQLSGHLMAQRAAPRV